MNESKEDLSDVATMLRPPQSGRLVSADASPAAIGQLKHGLDSDSAVERLAPSPTNAKGKGTATPFLYPFELIYQSHEAIDHIFREAFTQEREIVDKELLEQARQAARDCMTDVLSGNTLMRITPEQLQAIEQQLREVSEQVAREAIKLSTPSLVKNPKDCKRPTELRREIRDHLRQKKPVQDFKQKHLGFAASVEQERKIPSSNEKHTE